jgi:argininosuccinate lyase
MAEPGDVTPHKFVEGIGGRLATPKSQSYADAVLSIEGRNNRYLAKYMLTGDLACVLSAWELGVTPDAAARPLIRCLLDLLPRADVLGLAGNSGDIVLQREFWVTDAVGQEVGSWLHVGRNRAESLRGSLPRLFFREALWREHIALMRLVRVLVDRAEPVIGAVAPFYHHLQHAGRTTLGEYLLSWAMSFQANFERIAQTDRRLDLAPPPNCGREIVVELINRAGRRMGFSRVARLWEECFITEEHFSEPYFVLVQIAVALARLAEDLRLWMTAEFNFFELADQHASGSSGRPQKKNPFGLQAVINGAAIGAGRLAAQFATNITVSEEADTTYHAYSMYQYAHDVVAWTEFMADVVEQGEFKLGELERKSALGYAGAREALDVLVYEHKVPYRNAHRTLGELVRTAEGGAGHAALVAQLQARLPDPRIDADGLVRTMTGASQAHIMLNHKAYKTVHDELDRNLRAMAAALPANPVDSAIARLVEEARRAIA